jgi:TetR/AcrR family transcriptional regulator, cholesterol catabolism regulator
VRMEQNTNRPATPVSREEIIRTAASVFRKYGYRAATLKDIAELVGIQKASLYHHITSKEELLFAILDDGLHPTIEAVEPLVNDAGLTPCERLARAVFVHVQVLAESIDSQAVFINDSDALTSNPARQQEYMTKRHHYEQLMRKIVRGALEANGRADDPKLVTFAVLGMCNYMARWFQVEGPLEAKEIAATFSNLALEMVGCD